MINFKESAVCYGGGKQWYLHDGTYFVSNCFISDSNVNHKTTAANIDWLSGLGDFQLNEPREGWYIPKSELDKEEKYNKAVEVFGLFGFKPYLNYGLTVASFCNVGFNKSCGLMVRNDDVELVYNVAYDLERIKTKCTFDQLMAIGELKRKMLERERVVFMNIIQSSKRVTLSDVCKELEIPLPHKGRRNKSKQAYDILKGLDYEHDLFKQRWYKKEWV